MFAGGDIIRPHLLTTAIGQASIAADSIDRYLGSEEMAKRPKIDVHHFSLLDKLREVNLEPEPFKPLEEHDLREIDRGLRGTDLPARRSVASPSTTTRTARDRGRHASHEELFLGHFAYQERIKRTEIGPSSRGGARAISPSAWSA